MPPETEALPASSEQPVAHKPKYRRLTDADRVYMLTLRERGMSQAQIAQQLGCNQSSVSDWLSRCDDKTTHAITFLRGSALKMARNVVDKGSPAVHVDALKGLSVLKEKDTNSLVVNIGIKDSDVLFGTLSTGQSEPGPSLRTIDAVSDSKDNT